MSSISRIFFLSVLCLSMFQPSLSSNMLQDLLHHPNVSDAISVNAERLIRSFNLYPEQQLNDEELTSATTPYVNGSGPSLQEFGRNAGYFRLPNTKDARMFYFFFESRTAKTDPVVLWLTGGPGCSSSLALFYENGPVKIMPDLSLAWNDYGWDMASNILFVDQPTGTGFSFSTDKSDFRHNQTGVSNDLYSFLQEFMKSHPEFVNHDFYITGESFAGIYIPPFASRIVKGNTNREGIHINLKGFAIGNGNTNATFLFKSYTDFSLDNKIINQTEYKRIDGLFPSCQKEINACGIGGEDECRYAYLVCNLIFEEIFQLADNINYYDIRKKCEGELCYDMSRIEKFLNNLSVKKAIGVGTRRYVSCSSTVFDDLASDMMRNYEAGIPALLENGIKILIYAGDQDLVCNWLGLSRWVPSLAWSGQKAFQASATVPFMVDGSKAGEIRSHGPLTFLKVYNAGHLVPMDQPKAALEMLKRWIKGSLVVGLDHEH